MDREGAESASFAPPLRDCTQVSELAGGETSTARCSAASLDNSYRRECKELLMAGILFKMQEHVRECNDDSDVLVAFRTPLTVYDALLVLREDSLPQAARTLRPAPLAAALDAGSHMQCLAPSHATRAVLQPIPSGANTIRLLQREAR